MKAGWYYAIAEDGFGRTVEIAASPDYPDKAFMQKVDEGRERYAQVHVVQCVYNSIPVKESM